MPWLDIAAQRIRISHVSCYFVYEFDSFISSYQKADDKIFVCKFSKNVQSRIYCFESVGWLFCAYRPFETVFQSISGRLPEGGGKNREMKDERKNVQTTTIRTYCKPVGSIQISRTPRHWKFTQHENSQTIEHTA